MTAACQYCLHERGPDDLPVQVPPGRDLIAGTLTNLCVFATGELALTLGRRVESSQLQVQYVVVLLCYHVQY
jgi:hypothetical protein